MESFYPGNKIAIRILMLIKKSLCVFPRGYLEKLLFLKFQKTSRKTPSIKFFKQFELSNLSTITIQ